jgi:hypothetical protein
MIVDLSISTSVNRSMLPADAHAGLTWLTIA